MALLHGEEYLFSCVDSLLKEHDLVVGNLEGPITTKRSTSMDTRIGSPENYYFTFPTSTASLLFRHNIKIVSIGNNHINNQGAEGIVATKHFLASSSVMYFGGLQNDSPLQRTSIKGIEISFINYNQFGGLHQKEIARMKEELIQTKMKYSNVEKKIKIITGSTLTCSGKQQDTPQ